MNIHLRFASVVLTILPLCAFSQQIPNGSLENWETTTAEKPVGWDTPDVIAATIGVTDRVVEKESGIVQDGNFSAKLTTKTLSSPFLPMPITVPGILALGQITFNLATLEGSVIGGFAMDEKPDALMGYYQYAPAGSDSMYVAIIAKAGGDTIGAGFYADATTSSSYQIFMADITYYIDMIPDSIQIIVSSSSGFTTATEGSILYVDNMSLTGLAAVHNIPGLKMNIYPNPTSDYINIQNPLNYKTNIEIYDMNGSKVDFLSLAAGLNTIDVRKYASGIYMFRVLDNGNQIYSAKFKVSK